MSTTKHRYDSASQQRILKVMMCLFGYEIDGIAPGQLAKLAETTASNITRDIHNLVAVGLAERLPHNDHVRITPRLGQKAMAILANIQSASSRVDEAKNRYTRN